MNSIQLKALSDNAIPIDSLDDGSDRQMAAEEIFFDAVRDQIGENDYRICCNIMNNCLMPIEEAIVFALNCTQHGLDYVIEALDIDESLFD